MYPLYWKLVTKWEPSVP